MFGLTPKEEEKCDLLTCKKKIDRTKNPTRLTIKTGGVKLVRLFCSYTHGVEWLVKQENIEEVIPHLN